MTSKKVLVTCFLFSQMTLNLTLPILIHVYKGKHIYFTANQPFLNPSVRINIINLPSG
jgi:hypothetical protein